MLGNAASKRENSESLAVARIYTGDPLFGNVSDKRMIRWLTNGPQTRQPPRGGLGSAKKRLRLSANERPKSIAFPTPTNGSPTPANGYPTPVNDPPTPTNGFPTKAGTTSQKNHEFPTARAVSADYPRRHVANRTNHSTRPGKPRLWLRGYAPSFQQSRRRSRPPGCQSALAASSPTPLSSGLLPGRSRPATPTQVLSAPPKIHGGPGC